MPIRGYKGRHRWCPEDDAILREYYTSEGSLVAHRLDAPVSNKAVAQRAHKLGLRCDTSLRFTLVWADAEYRKKQREAHIANPKVLAALARANKTRLSVPSLLIGRRCSDRTRAKISESLKGNIPWNKGKKFTYKERKTRRGRRTGNYHIWTADEEDIIREFYPLEGTRCLKRLGIVGLNRVALKRRAKILGVKGNDTLKSAIHKALWQEPSFVRKQMKARGVSPNKAEMLLGDILEKALPGEYRYVGDGAFILAGKCPDFMNVNGQKKLIELYGDYWHRGDNPQDRIDLFREYGYRTLILWESELKDIDALITALYNFNGSAVHV